MRRAALTLSAALVLATPACGSAASDTVCPAIGYLDAMTVRLAEDWPSGDVRSVTVTCEKPCGPDDLGGGPGTRELSAPVAGSTATLTIWGQPASVVVAVREGGTPVTEVDADLDWRRVGGSAECGGPHAAEVTVPAP